MKFGTVFEQGDILIVPFPFSNLNRFKQRPVVVISNSVDNSLGDDLIVCGITSNLHNSKHSILIDNTNLVEGVLFIRSRIKIDKLFTIEKIIIKKKIGKLNNKTLKCVKRMFVKLI